MYIEELPSDWTFRYALKCKFQDLLAEELALAIGGLILALAFGFLLVTFGVMLLRPAQVEEFWYGDEHVYVFHDRNGSHTLKEVPKEEAKDETSKED